MKQCCLCTGREQGLALLFLVQFRSRLISSLPTAKYCWSPSSPLLFIRENHKMFSWRKSFKITEINQPLCFSDYFEKCFISLHHIPLLSPISCVNLFILTDIITLVKVLNFTLTWAPENYTSWLQFFRLPKHHFLLLIVKRKYFCLLHTHLNALNGPALCQNGLVFAWYFIIIS